MTFSPHLYPRHLSCHSVTWTTKLPAARPTDVALRTSAPYVAAPHPPSGAPNTPTQRTQHPTQQPLGDPACYTCAPSALLGDPAPPKKFLGRAAAGLVPRGGGGGEGEEKEKEGRGEGRGGGARAPVLADPAHPAPHPAPCWVHAAQRRPTKRALKVVDVPVGPARRGNHPAGAGSWRWVTQRPPRRRRGPVEARAWPRRVSRTRTDGPGESAGRYRPPRPTQRVLGDPTGVLGGWGAG